MFTISIVFEKKIVEPCLPALEYLQSNRRFQNAFKMLERVEENVIGRVAVGGVHANSAE